MIEISDANYKPAQRFLGCFLRSVEISAKLAKVYIWLFVIVACVQTSPISFCFFVTFL